MVGEVMVVEMEAVEMEEEDLAVEMVVEMEAGTVVGVMVVAETVRGRQLQKHVVVEPRASSHVKDIDSNFQLSY